MPADVRANNPHMLLLGGSNKGKSRLMASMIAHDIKSRDRAVVLIDSDGSLSELMLSWLASQPDADKLAKRVICIDPSDPDGTLRFNPLEIPSGASMQSAASAIVRGFKAIYTEPPGSQSQWSAQTANILRNAILLLMANGRTLVDLQPLLQDNDFRDILLETVEKSKDRRAEYVTILDAWSQYKKLARTEQWITWVEPILNRIGPMLGDSRIRPVFSSPHGDLDLEEVIAESKIVIVRLPRGELDENANLLGSLIVTGIQNAALAMSGRNADRARPVALYLDEFDSFIEKETIEKLKSETRRFRIGFVGSIKTLQHLPEEFRAQLTVNIGTIAVFALAKKDADLLGTQMFRVDGLKTKHKTIANFLNPVNTSPQWELIMDEEKLNIDRVAGLPDRTYFCYCSGSEAGVFKLNAPVFDDVPPARVDDAIVEKMRGAAGR